MKNINLLINTPENGDKNVCADLSLRSFISGGLLTEAEYSAFTSVLSNPLEKVADIEARQAVLWDFINNPSLASQLYSLFEEYANNKVPFYNSYASVTPATRLHDYTETLTISFGLFPRLSSLLGRRDFLSQPLKAMRDAVCGRAADYEKLIDGLREAERGCRSGILKLDIGFSEALRLKTATISGYAGTEPRKKNTVIQHGFLTELILYLKRLQTIYKTPQISHLRDMFLP